MSRSEPASRRSCWTSPLAWAARCGLGAVLLVACGGAEFTNAIGNSPDDAGSTADAGSNDAGSNDAGSSIVDTGVPASKDSSGSPPLDSGTLDTGIAIDTGVSCTVRAPVTESACDIMVTYPNNFCAFVITAAVSAGEYVIETTPAACATWCDFSCACLVEAGACPGQADCWPRPDGTLTLECDER